VIAFLPSIGYQEMFLILVIGLLLYGRNLPEAGRSLGRVAAQLRRGWHEFKDQMDRDGDLREVKKSLQGTAEELRRVAQVPRAIADPKRAIRDLASEAMAPETAEPATKPEGTSEPHSESTGQTADADPKLPR
jgi:Sec-independent protein translocase protein TatA